MIEAFRNCSDAFLPFLPSTAREMVGIKTLKRHTASCNLLFFSTVETMIDYEHLSRGRRESREKVLFSRDHRVNTIPRRSADRFLFSFLSPEARDVYCRSSACSRGKAREIPLPPSPSLIPLFKTIVAGRDLERREYVMKIIVLPLPFSPFFSPSASKASNEEDMEINVRTPAIQAVPPSPSPPLCLPLGILTRDGRFSQTPLRRSPPLLFSGLQVTSEIPFSVPTARESRSPFFPPPFFLFFPSH